MKNELNLFDNKEIKSFNGKTLSDNLKKAEIVIIELEDDFKIHNHSNTQFLWSRFILNHKGGLRNVRQIIAEISNKQAALIEVKHKHAKKLIQLQKLNHKLTNDDLDQFEKLEVQADLAEAKDNLKLSLAPIEGAIKDILTLKKYYDEIVKQYENYSEKDLENEEVAYWIRRLFSQALADIRECGAIRAGNQLSIEQMNLNISFVEKDLKYYITEKERTSKKLNGEPLHDFLEHCVEKYSSAITDFDGYGGFKGEILDDSVYHPTSKD